MCFSLFKTFFGKVPPLESAFLFVLVLLHASAPSLMIYSYFPAVGDIKGARETKCSKVPSNWQILGKSCRPKAKHTIFNEKITFVLEPQRSCAFFLWKAHVIDKYSQVFVEYTRSF